jgi:hypothetical protein
VKTCVRLHAALLPMRHRELSARRKRTAGRQHLFVLAQPLVHRSVISQP